VTDMLVSPLHSLHLILMLHLQLGLHSISGR
jgi:hypothetical protein